MWEMVQLKLQAPQRAAHNPQEVMDALSKLDEADDSRRIISLILQAKELVGRSCEVRYFGNCPKGQTPEILSKQGTFLGLVPLPRNRRFALHFRFGGAKVREPRIPTDRIVSATFMEAP
jgi:hypothetical protein